VNERALQALPADVRSGLQAVAGEFQARMVREITTVEAQERDKLRQAGIEITAAVPADIARGQQVMQSYWEEWAQKGGSEAVEALKAVRQALGK
ncbi:MAG: hypothetical protein IRY95_06980, partial [Clostridia bacterium]|nr:hypothetical protein [Clostridia bacterium]